MPPPETPQEARARAVQERNPAWLVRWDAAGRTYRAAMADGGGARPPWLADTDPARLEERMRGPVDELLTRRLCAAVREMERRGLLPAWRPPGPSRESG